MMQWLESDQLLRKSAQVAALLNRKVDRAHPSPRSLAYRARITMKVNTEGSLGYHQARSHTWVPIPACDIARPEINEVLKRIPKLPSQLPGLELRSDGQRVVLAANSARPRGQRKSNSKTKKMLKKALASLDPDTLGVSGVSFDGQTLSGDSTLHLAVCGIAHQISPSSFYQVNLEVNELLVQRVTDLVLAAAPTTVLDLYAGIGNMSLPLAAQGIKTVLMEQEGSSVADAEAAIARNRLNAKMIRGNAGRFQAGDVFFDVALLDPPRGGAPRLMPQLLTTRPKMVVYVSCNPATLARDVQPALQSGYEIELLEVIDMFPQTDHIETLCVLRRA